MRKGAWKRKRRPASGTTKRGPVKKNRPPEISRLDRERTNDGDVKRISRATRTGNQ